MLPKQSGCYLLLSLIFTVTLFAEDAALNFTKTGNFREFRLTNRSLFNRSILNTGVPISFASDKNGNTKKSDETGGTSFGMGAGIGSVTINGEIYNHISLRPELTMGKFGIGLDIYFYMDENGKIREEDWDEFSDYLKKIYYVRWGRQGDPFFIKAGGLDQVTLGYGILMDGYMNTARYPQERKIGIHTGMNYNQMGWEAFMADINEISGPGLVGGRITYQPLKRLGLKIGGTLVMDFDPYQGLNDEDGDGIADAIDIYTNADDNQMLDSIKSLSPSQIKYFRENGLNIPDSSILEDKLPTIGQLENKPVGALAIDAGLPIFQNKLFKIDLYSQFAHFIPNQVDYYRDSTEFNPGWGFSFPGVRINFMKFLTTKVEYRYADKHFLFSFWDRNYDFARTQIWKNDIYTKQEINLYQDRVLKGVYGLLRADLLNLITLESQYQHMAASDYKIRSFQANASLKPFIIPKVADATAFYQRNNEDNPFDFANPSANTLLGYRVGLQMGQGAILYYKFQKSYQDINGNGSIEPDHEAITITTIETGITF